MAVLASYTNISAPQTAPDFITALQRDAFTIYADLATPTIDGVEDVLVGVYNLASTLGIRIGIRNSVGTGTVTVRAYLKGDEDFTAAVVTDEPTIQVVFAAPARLRISVAVDIANSTFQLRVNNEPVALDLINPALEPFSNYAVDSAQLMRFERNNIGEYDANSTMLAGVVIDKILIEDIVGTQQQHDDFVTSGNTPGEASSAPTILSLSNFSAGATATFTVDAYNTVSAVAIDSTSITSGIVEQTATTISFPVGYDETKIGTSVDVTVTDSGGTSTAFSATYNAPAGYTGVLITSLATSPALSLLEVGDWWGTDNSNFVVSVDGTVSLAVGTPDGDTANWLLIQNQSAFSGTFTATEDAVDTESPVITLVGATSVNVTQNASFVDLGATWTDNVDGSGTVYATESVNTATLGAVGLTYSYTDAAGNPSPTLNRTVTVVATAIAAPSNLSGMVYSGTSGQYTAEENSPFSFDVVVTNLLGPVTLSGLDASLFSIALVTGSTYRVTSIARDYELPEDSNSDNIYNVTVNCNGVALGTQITITDVSEVVPDTSAPVLSSVVIPTIDVLANTDFEVTFNSDEEGIFYWVITSSATPPSKPFTNTAVMDIGSNAVQANAGPSTNTHFHYYAEDNA